MSRWIGCPCGAEQSDAAHPTPNMSHIISNADLDAITYYGECFENGIGEPGEHDDEPISANGFEARAATAFICWQCKRLLIFKQDGTLDVYERREETQ